MADKKQPKGAPAKRKPAARKTSARGTTKRTTAKRDPAEIEEPLEELDLGAGSEEDDEAPVRAGRPVAVGGAPSFLTESLDDEDATREDDDEDLGGAPERSDDLRSAHLDFDETAPAPPVSSGADEIERPVYEAVAGALGALLAIMVFLPWYRGPLNDPTGWSSGTFGPVIAGLGVAAAAIVVLRRLGVAIRFPVHHSLVLEGIGWAAVFMLLIKLNFAPRIAGPELETTWFLRGTLMVGLALALVGGSVSQGVALVLRPGWFSDTADRLGTGLVALAIVVGAVFGLTNDAGFSGFASNPDAPPLEQGYPRCAQAVGFPVPPKMTPSIGGPQAEHCFAQMTTKLNVDKTVAAYAKALRAEDWAIVYDSREDREATFGQLQAKRGKECGSVTVIGGKNTQTKQTQVTIIIGPEGTICNLEQKLREQRGDQ